MRYSVMGFEIGGQNGTPHLQGFVQFSSAIRMTTVQAKIPPLLRAHLELMRKNSTPQQAAEYCKKDGNFKEWGEIVKQGQRRDLEEIKEMIDRGTSYEELWDTHFPSMVQYRKSFLEYCELKRSSSLRDMPRVFVFWGPTGTGKTRRAHAVNPESTFVYPGAGWFDGYRGQQVAIFDEFDGSDVPFSLWKRLCDRYKMLVPIKGGFTAWTPSVIIFTSNIEPLSWWRSGFGNVLLPNGFRDQMLRRVECTVHMTQEWTPESESPVLPVNNGDAEVRL